MRLLFLCGSLDPGRDGVGDYVRRLAEACSERGHEVRAIALNDPAAKNETQLSHALPWSQRGVILQREAAAFAPDWISLHFVPYAFHSRGFCFRLARALAVLPPRAQRHIMFHETWITAAGGASWKRRLTAFLQRQSVRATLASFGPEVAHTSTTEYQRLLAQIGVRAELLPMFGNIPNCGARADEWLAAKLRQAGAPEAKLPLLCFFGALYPEWSPEPLFAALRKQQARCCVVSIGSLRDGAEVWENMAARYAHEHVFLRLGHLPPDQISSVLNTADLGVTAMPLAILGKSGTAAAMLEHGLPLLVTRFDEPPPAAHLPELNARGVYPLNEAVAARLPLGLSRREPRSLLDETAATFLEALQAGTSLHREPQLA